VVTKMWCGNSGREECVSTTRNRRTVFACVTPKYVDRVLFFPVLNTMAQSADHCHSDSGLRFAECHNDELTLSILPTWVSKDLIKFFLITQRS